MIITITILLISNIGLWIFILNKNKKTPKVHINDKNEAIITLADEKTEIYNYDLNRER